MIEQKLSEWRALAISIEEMEDALGLAKAKAAKLEAEVLAELGDVKIQKTYPGVVLIPKNKKGSYDYEGLAGYLGASAERVAQHTKQVIDWKAVCDGVSYTAAQKKEFFKKGEAYVDFQVDISNGEGVPF